jgi:hypothetical protein
VGEHGHARTAFRRAIERGNLVVAELDAREIGRLDLGEALELTALVVLRDRDRGWEVVLVAAALQALSGPAHEAALAALRAASARQPSR